MIHAGEATNVVPDSCELQGTVRTFTLEVLDLIERRMKQMAEHVCAAHDAQCEFEFVRNYPPTINSAREAAFARRVMASIVGEEHVDEQEPTMGAEDFAFMLQAKPGAYCFIANGDGAHREMGHGGGPCMLHNPSYDFNDDLIPLGATYWVRLAEEWLAQELPHDECRATPSRPPTPRPAVQASWRQRRRRPGHRIARATRKARARRAKTLAMDVVRDGPVDADKLLIVSSACHGVEGYCGTGVQVFALHDAAWRAKARAPAWLCSISTDSTPMASRTCGAPRTRTWT